jgi:hypothetical protein
VWRGDGRWVWRFNKMMREGYGEVEAVRVESGNAFGHLRFHSHSDNLISVIIDRPPRRIAMRSRFLRLSIGRKGTVLSSN